MSSKPSVSIPSDNPPSQLVIEDLVVGTGDEAVKGRNVDVHYVGVACWDQGVVGMKVGGRRQLTIPPDMGYGSRGAGGVIKGGETLVFVVDLLNVF